MIPSDVDVSYGLQLQLVAGQHRNRFVYPSYAISPEVPGLK